MTMYSVFTAVTLLDIRDASN